MSNIGSQLILSTAVNHNGLGAVDCINWPPEDGTERTHFDFYIIPQYRLNLDKGMSPKTIRALALISESIYGTKLSVEILKDAVLKAKIREKERLEAIRGLGK